MSGWGATILDAEGPRLTPSERDFFRDADPFGFILFARNAENPEQLRRLTAEMRDAVGRDAPIAIDQEGGRVQRLRGPHWREWIAPLDEVARAGAQAERVMYLRYRIIAAELRDCGIDCNCAPLVDVAGPDTHAFLRNRCYGEAPDRVARIGRAVAAAHLDGGVLPVVKHIPGHGRAATDSHLDLPHVMDMRKSLEVSDFQPFAALSDLPLGMTAHVVYDDIDTAPATLSPTVMRLVREEIGFSGLVMSDDISMGALTGDLGTNVRGAIAAGCDVVLHCNGTLAEREAAAAAAGRMAAAAQQRAERAISARRQAEDTDVVAFEADLRELVGDTRHG